MIITRTPFRVSFFGGGTDYPTWYREHGGAVLSTTINKYCYLTCRYLPPFFEHKSHIIWSRIEKVVSHDDIAHPAVRACLKFVGMNDGVAIHHDGDLPARSGLGSSSAFTVGLLNALYALQGKMVSKQALAREAIHVERNLLGESVGDQDQIATSFGGLNQIELRTDGSFTVKPVILGAERLALLQDHLILFFTGVVRNASSIAAEKISSLKQKEAELREMRAMVDQAIDILIGGEDIVEFGRLVHESWMLKRSLTSGIAPAFVDDIYARARQAGAIGGKVLGAGGGGFMLFCVPPERRAGLLTALADLIAVPIEFDSAGSQVIFYDAEFHAPQPIRSERWLQVAIGASGTG
jgi:D-glycero-alpha-D-manno-heptose-7-phosphate kinase